MNFKKIEIQNEKENIVKFLLSEKWPFHVNESLTTQKVESMFKNGSFDENTTKCFWIQSDTNDILGYLRLYDLDDVDDGYPLFDLRILNKHRGKGVGKKKR